LLLRKGLAARVVLLGLVALGHEAFVVVRKLLLVLGIRVFRPPEVVGADPLVPPALLDDFVAKVPFPDISGGVFVRQHLGDCLHIWRHDKSITRHTGSWRV